MKHSPSFLFASIILAALFQAGNVAGATRMLSFLNKGLHGYGGSRSTGDIEIGPDPSFQCPSGTSIAPHPEKCEFYYTCYFASPVTLWQCYSNYLFDVTYNGCNYPEMTDCGNRQRPGSSATTTPATTTRKTGTPQSTNPVFSCPTVGGFFPISPEECLRHYYACAAGVAYVMLCPLEGLFDPVTLTCKPANEVSCKNPAFTCPDDGFYPVEGECTGVYFVCASGVAYESLCPNNGIFDPDRHICATPDAVPCAQESTSTSTTTPSTTTSTTPSTTTSTTPSTTTSTTPSTTTSTTPSTTTSTTPSTTTSTTPSTTTSTTTTTASTPTTTPSGEFNCPVRDGKYPDPTNCHAYYVCISGVAFPSKCPENGCFEAASQQCSPSCTNCSYFFSVFF